MFSISPVEFNLISLSLNPHIAVGYVGPEGHEPSGPPSELTLPWTPLPDNPYLLAMLNWRARLSTFAGREKEMATLSEWFNSPQPILMKFICDAGGAGKTRLAAEFAQKLRKEGCAAGFVNVNSPQKFYLNKNGTLIIIDYPEDSPNEIPSMIKGLANHENSKYHLRILFLTRQPQSSWLPTIEENHGINLLDRNPIELEPLSGASAHKIYVSALGEASTILNKPAPEGVSQDVLTDWLMQYPEHNRPLFILAAAVHSADNPEDSFLRYSSVDVVKALADREKNLLRQRALANGFTDLDTLVKLVTLATLRDGLNFTEVLDLAEKKLIPLRGEPDEIKRKLERTGLLIEGSIPPQKPDIPAAAFVVSALADDIPGAAEMLWAGLGIDMESGLKRLARLSHDSEIECGITDFRIRDYFEKAVAGNLERCRILDREIRYETPLGCINAVITARRTLLNYVTNAEDRAVVLNNLSSDLHDTGETREALSSIKQAVEIRRRLAGADPNRFDPALAMSLNNLSINLVNAGYRLEALDVAKEATDIFRRLAEIAPDRFMVSLAGSLNTLSEGLHETGDDLESVRAIKEAVALYRQFYRYEPSRFKADVAMSLSNLSLRLSNIGDTQGSLAAITEAVELYRELNHTDPATFSPHLGTSLHTLSNSLIATGDEPGALRMSREAVDMFRRLGNAHPSRFSSDLAVNLDTLSRNLVNSGDQTEALYAIQESVFLYRQLAKAEPGRFMLDLAASLNNLAAILFETGDKKGALAPLEESVAIRRQLANDEPARFLQDLANSLGRLSFILIETGDKEGAVQVLREMRATIELINKLKPL